MSIALPPFVMLNLFQHNLLPLFILKQVQDDAVYCRKLVL